MAGRPYAYMQGSQMAPKKGGNADSEFDLVKEATERLARLRRLMREHGGEVEHKPDEPPTLASGFRDWGTKH